MIAIAKPWPKQATPYQPLRGQYLVAGTPPLQLVSTIRMEDFVKAQEAVKHYGTESARDDAVDCLDYACISLQLLNDFYDDTYDRAVAEAAKSDDDTDDDDSEPVDDGDDDDGSDLEDDEDDDDSSWLDDDDDDSDIDDEEDEDDDDDDSSWLDDDEEEEDEED